MLCADDSFRAAEIARAVSAPMLVPGREEIIPAVDVFRGITLELTKLLDRDRTIGARNRAFRIEAVIEHLVESGLVPADFADAYFGDVPADPAEQLAYVVKHRDRAGDAIGVLLVDHFLVFAGPSSEYRERPDHLAIATRFLANYRGLPRA